MLPQARLHDRLLWGLLVLVGLAVTAYASWSLLPPKVPSSTVAEFQLTDQTGRTITRDDLDGKVCVVGFIFTRCRMSCPQITAAMAELQRRLPQPDLRLIAISVDPKHDTPEVLQAYASNPAVHADPNRWLFLTDKTGNKKVIYELIERSFQERPQEDASADPGFQIAHSNRLILIDRQGKVHGSRRCVTETESSSGELTGTFAIDEVALARLVQDAEELLEGRFIRLSMLPTVNAILNGTSAVLLCAGYVLIRRRKIAPHAVCMLAAVVVSTIFLTSYLYYHFHRGATPFQGQGWLRPMYFAILISHTSLAVVVVPLVLWTLYRAARGQFAKHVRIARWTLPIWLYVSVTGVVVYLLLYHWPANSGQ